MSSARISAAELKKGITRYGELLREHRDEIDRLNVYPVPDADTGTNMMQTVEEVVSRLDGAQTMSEVCDAMSRGSLAAARGNSGVILSQVFRGLASRLDDREDVAAEDLCTGLRDAVDRAYEAVGDPMEGTILTVLRSAADAAEDAFEPDASVVDLLSVSRSAAHEAVAATTQLLPVLQAAGVVDAGGRGLSLFFDALLETFSGGAVGPAPADIAAPADPVSLVDPSGPRYEVVFEVETPAEGSTLRNELAALGESVAVIEGDAGLKCHVHTDDVDAAIAVGRSAGAVTAVEVVDLAAQVAEARDRGDRVEAPRTQLVCVVDDPELARLLGGLGADTVVTPEEWSRDLAAPDRDMPARLVLLVGGAEAETSTDGDRVVRLASPAASPAALLAFDPASDVEENLETVTSAARAVRTATIRKGGPEAWLAEVGDERFEGEPGPVSSRMFATLVDRSSEVVTAVRGGAARRDDDELLRSAVEASHPHVAIEFLDGAGADLIYEIGVE